MILFEHYKKKKHFTTQKQFSNTLASCRTGGCLEICRLQDIKLNKLQERAQSVIIDDTEGRDGVHDRQTDVRQKHCLMPLPIRDGGITNYMKEHEV